MLTGMARPFPEGVPAALLKTGPPEAFKLAPDPHSDVTAGFRRPATLISAIK